MIKLPADTQMTASLVEDLLKQHKAEFKRYDDLKNLYEGSHEILKQKKKADYKPDNRLVVNFAKVIVDTLSGFFIGNPIKTLHDDKAVSDYLEMVQKYNDQDDNNAELNKLCDIFGHGFELLFLDEYAQVGITYVDPREAMVVYDDTVMERPLFGLRHYVGHDKVERGEVYTKNKIIPFEMGEKGIVFLEEKENPFQDVQLIEYIANEERQGAFEGVSSLINAYNKAISEKANDVDYYADAYLLILGAILDQATLAQLRDTRIINMASEETEKMVVQFLAKPEADTTQENLINRLERLIYQVSMTANINDEHFGEASGISLQYKLLSMSNLANTKERKFSSGMNRRWKLVGNLPTTPLNGDAWMGIEYKFTRNTPANLLEEAQVSQALSGIVSQETQMKVLSIVDNVKDELQRKDEELDKAAAAFEGFGNTGSGDLIE